jgi:hypothetical protein
MSLTHGTYGTSASLGAWRFSRHLLKTLMDLNSSISDLALKAPIESRFGVLAFQPMSLCSRRVNRELQPRSNSPLTKRKFPM